MLGVRFSVCQPRSLETTLRDDPAGTVGVNARRKALSVAASHPGAAVIAADTVVSFEGRVLGKPNTLAQAREWLLSYAGKTQTVFTGVAMVFPGAGEPSLRIEATSLLFKEYDARTVEAYLALVNPIDRAGAYDVNERGDLLIAGKRVVGTNDKGEEIFESCPAAGTVTARVYVGGRRLLPESRVTAVPTGRSVTFTLLDLCGVVWGKDKGSPFENFIRREEEELFCALPAFSLTRITYEEIKYEVCALTEGDLDACAAQMRAEFAPLIAGARVLDSYNNIKKLDNCYALDIYYEVVREIAEGG